MSRVMAVAFEQYGQLHYLDPGDLTVAVGDLVLHPTDQGPEVARCVWAPEEVRTVEDLPLCPGLAGPEDLARDARNRRRRESSMLIVREAVEDHDLAMKVLAVDYQDLHEGEPLTAIYYQADKRVDFRRLVGDLARRLQCRIDLRQVGERDATQLTGGIGRCGRDLCCATWLQHPEPVDMRLARVQKVTGNPLAIQGQCGRLLCCLRYEHPLYGDFAKHAPAEGSWVGTPEGDGRVIGHLVPAEAVLVQLSTGQVGSCPLAALCRPARRARLMPALPLGRRDGSDAAEPNGSADAVSPEEATGTPARKPRRTRRQRAATPPEGEAQ